MIYRKIKGPDEPARYLTDQIVNRLNQGMRVLWLVPGGSAIAVTLKTTELLKDQDLGNLSVSLTDERYVPVDSADSNWLQLETAGFELPGAKLHPVLDGSDMPLATTDFDGYIRDIFKNTDFRIGLFGMGADGHTAGILPGSPAVSSASLASSYQAKDFKRITITPKAIGKIDLAVVYALGENKKTALEQLSQTVPLNVMPAQALKTAGELVVYNEYKG